MPTENDISMETINKVFMMQAIRVECTRCKTIINLKLFADGEYIDVPGMGLYAECKCHLVDNETKCSVSHFVPKGLVRAGLAVGATYLLGWWNCFANFWDPVRMAKKVLGERKNNESKQDGE